MQYGAFVYQNNSIIPVNEAKISAGNRSFRYGDGCFETLKMVQGTVPLWGWHVQRLWQTLALLQFSIPKHFTEQQLLEQVTKLATKNKHLSLARVRITVYAGNGGVFEFEPRVPHFLIETWQLPDTQNAWQENGLLLGVYPHAAKATDAFSALKTNNYLPYVMAAIWAKQHKFNDAIVVNHKGTWADTTITNIGVITKADEIITVTPQCGAVNGVMQQYLQQHATTAGLVWKNQPLDLGLLADVKEVFLMNSIHGIKWVKQVENSSFTVSDSYQLFQKFIQPLWGAA